MTKETRNSQIKALAAATEQLERARNREAKAKQAFQRQERVFHGSQKEERELLRKAFEIFRPIKVHRQPIVPLPLP